MTTFFSRCGSVKRHWNNAFATSMTRGGVVGLNRSVWIRITLTSPTGGSRQRSCRSKRHVYGWKLCGKLTQKLKTCSLACMVKVKIVGTGVFKRSHHHEAVGLYIQGSHLQGLLTYRFQASLKWTRPSSDGPQRTRR